MRLYCHCETERYASLFSCMSEKFSREKSNRVLESLSFGRLVLHNDFFEEGFLWQCVLVRDESILQTSRTERTTCGVFQGFPCLAPHVIEPVLNVVMIFLLVGLASRCCSLKGK